MTQRTVVVKNIIGDSALNPASRAVGIRLNTPGWAGSNTQEIIFDAAPKTDATGLWKCALPPQVDINPAGTWFTVQERAGTATQPAVIWTFQVPPPGDSRVVNGEVWLELILVDNPPNPSPISGGIQAVVSDDDSIVVDATDSLHPSLSVNLDTGPVAERLSTYVPLLGGAYLQSSLVNGSPVITLASPWGIDSGGNAYYQDTGASPGEAAALILEDDGSFALVHPIGATA